MHPSRNIDVYPIKFCVEKNLRLWKCGVYIVPDPVISIDHIPIKFKNGNSINWSIPKKHDFQNLPIFQEII
jgi:hypothetical protein